MLSLYDIGQEYERAWNLYAAGKLDEAVELCLHLSDELDNHNDTYGLPAKYAAHSPEDLAWHCYYTYCVSDLLYNNLAKSRFQSSSPITYAHLAVSAATVLTENHLPSMNISESAVLHLMYDVAADLRLSDKDQAAVTAYKDAIYYATTAIDRSGPDPEIIALKGSCEVELGLLYTNKGPDSAHYAEGIQLEVRGLLAVLDGLIAYDNSTSSIDYFINLLNDVTIYSENWSTHSYKILKRVSAKLEEFLISPDPATANVPFAYPEVVRAKGPLPAKLYFTEGPDFYTNPVAQTVAVQDPLDAVLAHAYGLIAQWYLQYGIISNSSVYFAAALLKTPAPDNRHTNVELLQHLEFMKAVVFLPDDIATVIDALHLQILKVQSDVEMLGKLTATLGYAEADLAICCSSRAGYLNAYQRIIDVSQLDMSQSGNVWNLCVAKLKASYMVAGIDDAEKLIDEVEELLESKDLPDSDCEGYSEKLRPYILLARMKNGMPAVMLDAEDEELFPDSASDISAESIHDVLLLHELAFHKDDQADLQRIEGELLRRGVNSRYLQQLQWLYRQ